MRNDTKNPVKELSKKEAVVLAHLNELATLLNVEISEIKDECCIFQIKKLMDKLCKVVLRYNFCDSEIVEMLENAKKLGIGEILFAPAYVPAVSREDKKSGINYRNINAIIDYPFGESLYKSKLLEIKSSIKLGAKGVTVMMPTILLTAKNLNMLKKQAKTVGKIKKVNATLAFPATDLTEESIKALFKIISKTKLKSVTFTFMEENINEIIQKMELINEQRGAVGVKILAGITDIEGVKALTDLGVDEILTPYAEEIGKNLLNRFKVNSLKLC